MAAPQQPFRLLPASAKSTPEPFKVNVLDSKLTELKGLIASAKIAPATYESSQQDRSLGLTRRWLEEARNAWLKFDWRETEATVNDLPNYIINIPHDGDDYKIHFIALFSERHDAVPILMLHGWPGSVLEFFPILHLLKNKYTPQTLPYHIIVPSLPGYGFSSAPPLDKDFRLENCAQIFDDLMVQLGFEDGFLVQGGDVGSKVARVLGGVHDRVKAVHLNFCIMPDPGTSSEADYNDLEKAGLARSKWFEKLGSAYALLHATRPSTVSLALSTSPVAWLAWVGEKMLDWTDEDPAMSTILEDVSLYWLTDTIGTSLWPYRQLFTPGTIGAHENPAWHINKPLGFSWFPKEIAPVPKAWIKTTGDLVWFRQHDKGGHFAALEMPEVLLQDLEDFVGEVWPKVKV
ncbi:hypothetical protein LTR56_010464 [Elasticomyces elasticus]|nr:hypothetical protein LTR56_010464 [Elasticomyces elasticus]KAK3648444.1 hypothetical protein LTR22_013336 [Elasticomyces elasticus]KAK4905705.1 hypothetical protein LTR49_025048 [Elasticomyces elasticus]KAK5745614.1 hypothetical protein LTS12_023050 [Elasticomyces elasticus]